jgi:SulP family sulfate permease
MADRAEFAVLIRKWPAGLVLTATFFLTIVKDLTFGIITGCVLAAIFALLHRRVREEGV